MVKGLSAGVSWLACMRPETARSAEKVCTDGKQGSQGGDEADGPKIEEGVFLPMA